MALPATRDGASTLLGADFSSVAASFTLADPATFPASGRGIFNVGNTELVEADISGSTCTVVTRAVAPFGTFSTAQNHLKGDAVYLVASWDAMKSVFPTKLDEIVLVGSVASITFSSISQRYRHLQVDWLARGDTAAALTGLLLRFNGDAGANYDQIVGFTNSATTMAAGETLGATTVQASNIPANTATANYFGAGETKVKHYTSVTAEKHALSLAAYSSANTTGATVALIGGGKWRVTNQAITSITLQPGAGNFVAGSIFTLIGIP